MSDDRTWIHDRQASDAAVLALGLAVNWKLDFLHPLVQRNVMVLVLSYTLVASIMTFRAARKPRNTP